MRQALILAALVAAAASFLVISGTAGANNAAIVIRLDGTCGLFDGDGGEVVDVDGLTVINSGTGSGGVITCKASGVANSTGKAVKYDAEHNPIGPGLQCATFTGFTDKWTETVSASGEAMIRCQNPPLS